MEATIVKDGFGKEMKVVNGTAYHMKTPEAVIRVLENAMASRARIRVFLGDTETGRDWLEEHDVMGYVGRSTGNLQIPLLVNNSRSMGGGALLSHCIIRITIDKQTVYAHPTYHREHLMVHETSFATFIMNSKREQHARFDSSKKAWSYLRFMRGESNRK
jgi:hypothetical protein